MCLLQYKLYLSCKAQRSGHQTINFNLQRASCISVEVGMRTVNCTSRWLKRPRIKVLLRPSQSLGLNLIELLWNQLKGDINDRKPSDGAKLKQFCKRRVEGNFSKTTQSYDCQLSKVKHLLKTNSNGDLLHVSMWAITSMQSDQHVDTTLRMWVITSMLTNIDLLHSVCK